MSEAEVGLFVQRLRGLMTEIGEGSGVGRRGAFRSPADPSLTQSTIPQRPNGFCCELCGEMILPGRGGRDKEFYKEEGATRVQRALAPQH